MSDVCVLMSTYNGEKYLRVQLDSIINQIGVDIKILVRDDGSSDSTIEILKTYEKMGVLSWYSGSNLKPARSFMDLVRNAPACDFYAFSDQDDFWLPNKLSVAVEALKARHEDTEPLLYYSNTTLVDSELRVIPRYVSSARHNGVTQFSEAVVSSNATGCTFCFNKELARVIKLYQPSFQIMHDGWLHKVCLAIGGKVIYDENSYIQYRQHSNNVVGGTSTVKQRWSRRIKTIKETPCPRSRCVAEIIRGYSEFMSKENCDICDTVVSYKRSWIKRISLLFDHRIHSKSPKTDFLFRLAVLFGVF